MNQPGDEPWLSDEEGALLDRALAPEPVDPGVLRLIEASVLAAFSPPPWVAPLRLATGLLVAALLVLFAKTRTPHSAAWFTALLGGVVAIVALLRPRKTWALVIALVGSFALSVLAAGSETWAPLIGLKCAALELVSAALPLGAVLWAARRTQLPVSAVEGAGVAAAGALAAHVAFHLTCPVRDGAPHLFVFHTGTVVLAALLGGLSARRLGAPALGPA